MPRPPDSFLADEPTGLSNRLHFDIIFGFLFPVADRGVPVTLALFELDGFEELRGKKGDDEADRVLRDFARAMAQGTRTTDLAARFSRDRLVALLVDCNRQGGLIYADRIRDGARPFTEATGLTASVGVAAYEKGMEEAGDLISEAEAALDAALGAGGDRVMVPGEADGEGPL